MPFWLIWAFVGFAEMIEIWPAILVAGASFAVTQYFISNHHGPWLVDVGAALVSMACLVGFLMIWHPKRVWTFEGEETKTEHRAAHGYSRGEVARAWVPWIILSVIVFCWGTQTGKKIMNTPEKVFTSMASWHTPPSKITNPQFPVTDLDKLSMRMPPVVAKPTKEGAVFGLNWLSATGTGILISGLISGLVMGFGIRQDLQGLPANHHEGPVLAAHHRGHAGHWLHDAILRAGRHHGPGICSNRALVSVLWDNARLAGRGANRLGHVVQRALRQLAEDFGAGGGRLTPS